MLKNVLSKANLGGLVMMIKLGKKGEFEVQDANKTLLVSYDGEKDEVFKEEIGIFNLGMLLDILGFADEPKISYAKDGVLTVKAGNQSFEYMAADPSVIFTAYRPEKGEHILDKMKKAGKPVVIQMSAEVVKEILKGMSVLKDATVAFFEGNTFGVGGENENKYRAKLIDKTAQAPEKIKLPKKELQAIFTACEGVREGKGKEAVDVVTIELRGDGAPVVIREKDLTFVLWRQE
jgi:hypothetical protein